MQKNTNEKSYIKTHSTPVFSIQKSLFQTWKLVFLMKILTKFKLQIKWCLNHFWFFLLLHRWSRSVFQSEFQFIFTSRTESLIFFSLLNNNCQTGQFKIPIFDSVGTVLLPVWLVRRNRWQRCRFSSWLHAQHAWCQKWRCWCNDHKLQKTRSRYKGRWFSSRLSE